MRVKSISTDRKPFNKTSSYLYNTTKCTTSIKSLNTASQFSLGEGSKASQKIITIENTDREIRHKSEENEYTQKD